MHAPRRAHLVLRGGTVVTMDDDARVLDRGVVVVDGDRITAVGTEDEVGDVAGDTTIDCAGTVVIPGLVDVHAQLFAATPGIAHCPVSNAHFGNGVAPVRRLVERGARVGLGSDGGAVGSRGMIECTKAMLHQQRLIDEDPSVATAHGCLAAATRHGADLLGIPAGRIETGLLADLVVVELPEDDIWPVEDPVVALVTLATEREVRDVVVGGRVTLRSRRCTLVDETEVLALARGLDRSTPFRHSTPGG